MGSGPKKPVWRLPEEGSKGGKKERKEEEEEAKTESKTIQEKIFFS